ncbi:FMN-binding protein [Flavobacteriales bacterium]|nr:FMN-binding protein [Flavobacteriales bacterium]
MKSFVFLLIISLSYNTYAQWVPSESSIKKADKELLNYFGKDLEKRKISSNSNHYFLTDNDSIYGYLCFEQSPSKHDQFDFMAIYSAEMELLKLRVLVYRENYGGEISNKRWLNQFVTRNPKKVQAISGATISVESLKYSTAQLTEKMLLWKLSN